MRALLLSALMLMSGAAAAEGKPDQWARLYAGPSPFENVAPERYLAQSENAFAIRDQNPQAPVHILVVSKKRIPTVLHASPELVAEMVALAKKVARQEGIENDGFRLVINTHPNSGQKVYHFVIHVLGGKKLKWKLG